LRLTGRDCTGRVMSVHRTKQKPAPAAAPVAPGSDVPTQRAYGDLEHAHAYFNRALFDDALPRSLITWQRKSKAYGFFAGARFGHAGPVTLEKVFAGQGEVDEIALNPTHFDRETRAVLATLAHEMAHQWQHHFGTPTRAGYHNKEWAAKMRAIGLVPSSTGEPGGKATGQRVSHYIEAGGAFDRACDALIADGFAIAYVERWGEGEATKKKKAASKTKFTCPSCEANAWGKPELHVVCGDCEERMLSADESLGAIVAGSDDD
jgi:hypothetical protein